MSEEMIPHPDTSFDTKQLEVVTQKELIGELLGGDRAVTWCSMSLLDPKDRMLCYNAKNGIATDLDMMRDKEIEVRGVIMHWAEKVDPKTGQPYRFPRTAIIAADGQIYESFSKGIRDSVRDLAFTFDVGPWEPPVVVKMFTIKCSQPSPLQKLQYVRGGPGGGKPKEVENGKGKRP
jgi:Phage Single-stranded DNA-binding protein